MLLQQTQNVIFSLTLPLEVLHPQDHGQRLCQDCGSGCLTDAFSLQKPGERSGRLGMTILLLTDSPFAPPMTPPGEISDRSSPCQ